MRSKLEERESESRGGFWWWRERVGGWVVRAESEEREGPQRELQRAGAREVTLKSNSNSAGMCSKTWSILGSTHTP